MRICLILPRATFLEDPMIYPPLGLWYLWRILETMGHEVAYRDLSRDELPLEDYDLYFVSGTSPQMFEIKKLGGILRSHGKRSVVGGPHATTHDPGELLNAGYDIVVQGEADSVGVLEEIISSPGGTTINPARTETLEHLITPSRKAAWRYGARIDDEDGRPHRATSMFTSRGCPMSCAFCETVSIWGRKVRWVPIDTVRKEIEEIIDLGFTAIQFYDDIFPMNRERTREMMDILGHYHQTQNLIWRCFLRTDIIEKFGGFEYLKEMYDSGLREVLAGVESGSNQIKKNVRKGTTIEQDTQALNWCKELGIRFKASIVIGLPGETRETLETTRRWILENCPDRVELCGFIPLPGTPIVNSVEAGLDEFDIYWNRDEISEQYWYVGGGRERTVGKMLVGTSSLTPEQITEFRDRLVDEIKNIPAAVYHKI